jgi:hypothetical protein
VQNLLPLSLSAIVVRSDGFLHAEIDSEVVALNIAQGTCYGFNPVGSRIWNLLAKPIRVRDLCAMLVTEYEVDPAICERQVLDLLEGLCVEGLIIIPEDK